MPQTLLRETSSLAVPSIDVAIADIALLAGAVRPTSLTRNIRRSMLDLPVNVESTVIGEWRRHAERACEAGLMAEPSLRVLTDREGPAPVELRSAFRQRDGASVRVQTDQSTYRGTAGVLRDSLYGLLADDDFVLVGSAAQILFEPLADVIDVLRSSASDVALFSHLDGTPVGLILLRVGCLALVPTIGYCDLKEQALPLIAKQHDVSVLNRRHPLGTPVRSLTEYISALRSMHSLCEINNAYTENWAPSFTLVEEGSSVHPSAKLFDSVVLRGAVVEKGAMVVRSVVCPGGIVRKNQTITDRPIGTEGDC